LSQPSQFSDFGNFLHSFYDHEQQQISCFVHGSKILNYHKAVAEDIPFIWQKIEKNLTLLLTVYLPTTTTGMYLSNTINFT